MLYSILLAGGLSTRMGQDKHALQLDSETLLERSLSLLQNAGADRVFISGNIEGYACIPDLIPQCGPLGGIYSCLTVIKQDFGLDDSPMLIIPVDMPMLNADALAKVLIQAHGEKCCHYSGEVFPCILPASGEFYDYLHQLFSESTMLGGKRSMKGVMKFLKAKSISPLDLPENVFVNINYPQDWQVVKEKH